MASNNAEPSQSAPVNPAGNIAQIGHNVQPGSIAEIDDMLRCFDELSEFSFTFFTEGLGGQLVLSEAEYASRGIQQWIDSGNVDKNCVSFYDSSQRKDSDFQFPEGDFGEDTLLDETPVIDLRSYQEELAEKALLGQNTIICAPTGSGKTLVALHVMLKHLEEQQANAEPARKVVFFAQTIPLVQQQFQVIRKFLPRKYKVISLNGVNRHSLHLELIIPEYDVLVMTPRILENYLIRNPQAHVDLFSLMVFDECHHTSKDNPYNTLMLYYLKRKQLIKKSRAGGESSEVKLPQIIGLTASIGVGNAADEIKAKEYMLQICGNLDVGSISSVVKNVKELKEIVHTCEEELVTLCQRDMNETALKILEKMRGLEQKMVLISKKLKEKDLDKLLKGIPKDATSFLYCQWAVNCQKFARCLPRSDSSDKNEWKRFLIVIADYLSSYNIALALHDLVLLRDVMEYLKNCFKQYSENKNCTQDEYSYFESFSDLQEQLKDELYAHNPNLELLRKCLMKYLVLKGAGTRCIIFVQTRAIARALAAWLNSCQDKWIEGLKAVAFTGSSVPVSKGGMTIPQQVAAIEQFRSGELRILVATSVIEEGIDVPECNLVVKYNHVGNDISYMQAKGRCRKIGGICVILAKDKIIQKERENKIKAEMMERVVKHLHQMGATNFQRWIEAHQQKVMLEDERTEANNKIMRSKLRRQHFKMVCHGCGDVVIDSDDIRTICQIHRVVINRNILKQTMTLIEGETVIFDDIRKIGPVMCMGRLKKGITCNRKLGSMMLFSNIPFLVLGLTKFGFETSNQSKQQDFPSWKLVPYIVDEIGPDDYERYLPALTDLPANDEGNDENMSDDTNRTLEEKSSDEQNAAGRTEGKKVLPSQKPDNSAAADTTNTENHKVFEHSGGTDATTGLNKKAHFEASPPKKSLKETVVHPKYFSQTPSHHANDPSHQTNALGELHNLERVLFDAPSLSSLLSSACPPPPSEKSASIKMSLEFSSDSDDS